MNYVIKGQFYKGVIGKRSFYIVSELFYIGPILQRNYRKMTITWSFFYSSFVKFHSKKKIRATK